MIRLCRLTNETIAVDEGREESVAPPHSLIEVKIYLSIDFYGRIEAYWMCYLLNLLETF